MKLIGYWIRELRDTEYPPPQELVTQYEPAMRDMLAAYLDAGLEYAVYRAQSWCRFSCEQELGCRELSDGEWVWPEDLAHYVREHNVRLPETFIDHVRTQAGQMTATSFPDESADLAFWIEWCAAHRSHALQSRIRAARVWADAEAERMKASLIADRERDEGHSDIVCQWRGCNRLALRGRRLCASCLLEPSAHSRPYFEVWRALRQRDD